MSGVRRLSLEEFQAECKAQGVAKREQIALRCPVCGTVQNAQSLIDAKVGETFEKVEPYIGFSCVGRFTGAPAYRIGTPPGQGCDWTLGGLFRVHKLVIVTPDGKEFPNFELATPAEAAALVDSQMRTG